MWHEIRHLPRNFKRAIVRQVPRQEKTNSIGELFFLYHEQLNTWRNVEVHPPATSTLCCYRLLRHSFFIEQLLPLIGPWRALFDQDGPHDLI